MQEFEPFGRVNAFPVAALPEFADDEQLALGRSCGGQTDLKNVHVEAVNLAYKTVALEARLFAAEENYSPNPRRVAPRKDACACFHEQ